MRKTVIDKNTWQIHYVTNSAQLEELVNKIQILPISRKSLKPGSHTGSDFMSCFE